MVKKGIRSKFTLIGIVLIFSSLWAVKIISKRHYRNQLPTITADEGMNASLQEQISEAFQSASRYPTSERIGALGMVYHSSMYYTEAAKCYQLAIKKDQSKWKWSYYLGTIRKEMGEPREAIACFNRVLKINPEAYTASYYLGESYQIMNEADTAKKIFQKIAGLNDSNFQIKNTSRTHWFPLPAYARFELARLYTSAGQIVESEKLLKDIIQSYITFGPAYRQIGIIYRMKPDSALSKYYTDRANDLTIYTPPVDTLLDKLAMMSRSDVFLMKQIDLAMRSVNSQWAIDLIVQGLKYNHDSKYLISKAIKQFINTGGTKRALPYLAKHLQLYHDDATELMEVGSLLADAGFTEQATEYFQKAESLHIKDPEIRTELALLWFEKTMNKDKAGKLMIEQLDSNKDNAGILFHGVYLFLEMGESELAEKYLNILKRNSSNQPKVWILEGIIAEQNGEIDKAIRLMEQAFKILPADKYLINHLGNLYLREKMWQKSIQFFRKVLDIQPNNSLYQINLGSLLVSCPEAKFRNIPLGVDYCERAYYNYSYALPAKIAAGRALAIAYDELGNPNKAKYYIAHTVELASKVGISKSYMENLESLLKEFSSK